MSDLEGNVLERFVLQCDKCQGLSEELSCEHCGNIMVEVVNDATEFSQQRTNAKNLEGCSPPKLKRRREVNPLGMYLKEQKDLLTKTWLGGNPDPEVSIAPNHRPS